MEPSEKSIELQKKFCKYQLNRYVLSTNRCSHQLPASELRPKPSILFSSTPVAATAFGSASAIPETDTQIEIVNQVAKTVRWISAYDLWLQILQSEMEFLIPGAVTNGREGNGASESASKEKDAIFLELKSIVSNTALPEIQKDIHSRICLIDVWEVSRREGIHVLTSLQITGCEHKSNVRRIRMDQLLKLELGQETIIEKVIYITRTIDSYYGELEDLIDKHTEAKCLPFGIDPHVSTAITKLRTRDEAGTALPTDTINKYMNSKRRAGISSASSSPSSNLPDFFEPLFVGRRIPANPVDVETSMLRYDHIIETAIEWFMSWCLFVESVLEERDHASSSRQPLMGQQGFMEKQIRHIQSIYQEVKQMKDEMDGGTGVKPDPWLVLIKSCVFILESVTSLLEVTKHECSYLIHHLETVMIELGGRDLKKKPSQKNHKLLRLFSLRNIVLSKDRILLSSIDYLYREISFLIESMEKRFYHRKGYVEKVGPLFARVMSKYTHYRKERIENINIKTRTQGNSEPNNLNRQVSSKDFDLLDFDSERKSLGSAELEEASVALNPETLRSCPWTLPLDNTTEMRLNLVSSINTVESASGSDSFEVISMPLPLYVQKSSGRNRRTDEEAESFSRITTDTEEENPPSVFDIDSLSEQEESDNDNDQQRSVPDADTTQPAPASASAPTTAKPNIWSTLKKKLRFHKME